ncbi:MAG: hypothetical protein WCW33_01225 [Candidatus Babeliales bacterium]
MKWFARLLYCILTLLFTNVMVMAVGDSRIVIYLTHPKREVVAGAGQKLKDYKDLSLSGFACIYGGYMDFSDPDGLISFPLRHTTPKVYIVITPRIELVNIKENTFSHRKFVPGVPAIIYTCERKTDTKNNLYWHVTTEKIPANLIINPLALVIISHPNNIYISQGDAMCTNGGQMVLPPFYVVGRNDNEAAVSYALGIRRFFEPITKDRKTPTDAATQQIIQNI